MTTRVKEIGSFQGKSRKLFPRLRDPSPEAYKALSFAHVAVSSVLHLILQINAKTSLGCLNCFQHFKNIKFGTGIYT